MREEISEAISAIQDEVVERSREQPPKKMTECEDETNDNDDTGHTTFSNDSLNADVSDDEMWRLRIPPKIGDFSEEESLKILREAKTELEKIPEEERCKWLVDRFTEQYGSVMPKSLIELTAANYFDGDSGVGVGVKPDWLDIDKFRRGQKLATDNFVGVFYADVISLFMIHSFDGGLNPLIFTNLTTTPYTAFKRHLSSAFRMQTWYTSDPWTPGTPAYNNIRAVRRMHAMVRKKIQETPDDEYVEKTTIKDAWCPALSRTRRDMKSTCPTPKPGQCPHVTTVNFPELWEHKINQSEMVATQFSFVGLLVLHPKFFGLHDATDEDLEAFCHVWRGLGYLLGIEDDFNFCRGTVEDMRTRSKDFLEYWVKPNFRAVRPEWEHMMRCLIEGLQYYFPLVSYETCFLDMAETMNLDIPRTYESLSYVDWVKNIIIRFYFNHGSKLSILKAYLNHLFCTTLEKARDYDTQKHQELKEISARTIDSYMAQMKKNEMSSER